MEEPIPMRHIKRKVSRLSPTFMLTRTPRPEPSDRRIPGTAPPGNGNQRPHRVRSAEKYITTTEVEANLDQQGCPGGTEPQLAKCCNPIYGDEVFGFVSTQGIKIHRMDCPNAQEMFSRFGYRIIQAKWSGKGDNGYIVTLRVIGRDDIAIVTNITSVISKETGVTLRSLQH